MKIKHTQLPRVAYSYQDLMCINILISWFHEPEKYEWVKIEASASENLIGLDDVVAKLPDGRFELYQVKFTIDSERDDLSLSFDWLLDKKKNGTSLLQKWAQDVRNYGSRGLSIAALQTNRKPDSEFEACLENGRISLSKIPDQVLKRILKQLNNTTEIENFFHLFEFHHSLPEIDRFEDFLRDRLVGQHTTLEGWYRFLREVKRWAEEHDQPTKEGRVFLRHIQELLTLSISRPLSQYFEIPDGYLPPTEEFHDTILARTKMTGLTVIDGAPGMGKSTYLSFLTNQLERSGRFVIRHHYALMSQSLDDRITYSNVEFSLQNQIAFLFPHLFTRSASDREALGHWLKIVADNIDNSSEPLVIIIDGLDHVARERPEITQLTHLINQLLPNQNRVCLIFGTQPVGNTSLPPVLLAQMNRETNWIKVPYMGITAIRSWIEKLFEKSLITSPFGSENTQRWLSDISTALQKISNGYPLHLIYSVQLLINRNQPFNEYDIEKLPACPDGDIHIYYNLFWANLSSGAKQVLLLIGSVDFPWPKRSSIANCFSNSLEFSNAFSEVEHLLEQRRSGIVAFHGSLLVHLRQRIEYLDSRDAILAKVRSWLETQAPEYWKWAWKWIIDAELGKPFVLISGITHEWARTSFLKGYPLQHIQHIITEAEIYAHSLKLFPELVRLRLIKIRLVNGPEFQGYHYFDFLENTLTLNNEGYGLWWRADNIRIVQDKELPIIARLLGREHRDVLNSCYEEALRRLKFLARFSGHDDSNRIEPLIEIIIDIITCHSEPDFQKLCDFINRLSNRSHFFNESMRLLVKNGNGRTIISFPIDRVPQDSILDFQEYSILFSDNHRRKTFLNSLDKKSAISRISEYFFNADVKFKNKRFPKNPSRDHISSKYFRSVFFIALANYLTGITKRAPSPNDIRGGENYISAATKSLKYSAYEISVLIKSESKLDGLEIFRIFDSLSLPHKKEIEFGQHGEWQALYQSLYIISAHLSVLLPENKRKSQIDEQTLQSLQSNSWFHEVYWITVLSENSIEIDENISEYMLRKDHQELLKRRDNTATLTDDSVKLASISLRSGQFEIARSASELAARHFLGYGNRKDTHLGEIFNAIESCSVKKVGNIPNWLRRTSQFVHGMFDYTEKEIRHIPGMYLNLIAKHHPDKIVDEFSHYIKDENWWLARESLRVYLATAPLTSDFDLALINCITDPDILISLNDRSEREIEFKALADRKIQEIGGLRTPKENMGSSFGKTEVNINFSDFPPCRLMDLQEELTKQKVYISNDFVDQWIEFWLVKKKDIDLVEAFNNAWRNSESFPSHFTRSLSKIVPVVLIVDGKKLAFEWAVRDTKLNNYWSQWSGSEAAQTLQFYANIFKDRYEDFVYQSTTHEAIRSSRNWIIAPSSQLVSFYLGADKPDLAVEVTEVMIRNLEAEIEHLELAPIIWKDFDIPKEEISAHLCLIHFEWPDRLARKKTAKEIETLLSKDLHFQGLFLKRLETSMFEAEICDLLNILALCENKIFTENEILSAIKYPSLLSNHILQELGYPSMNIEVGDIEIDLNTWDNLEDRFQRGKNGIPQLYFSQLRILSKTIGVSLSDRLKYEWGLVSSREVVYNFNYSSFYGDYFYPQDDTTHSLSTKQEVVMLSAYLRTLAFAHSVHHARIEDVLPASLKVNALGNVFITLNPANKPTNWPILEKLKKEDSVPDISSLSIFLDQLLKNEDPVVFAKGPISIDHSGIICDLEVLMIQTLDNFLIDAEDIFGIWDFNGSNHNKNFLFLADQKYPDFFGRFEHDFLTSGFCPPNFLIGDVPISSFKVNESSVEFYGGSILNGTWAFWLDKWFPAHFRQMGSSMGTYTTVPLNILTQLKEFNGGHFHLIGRIKILDRRDYSTRSHVTSIFNSVEYELK